jgi:hypothetical protein
MSIRHRFPQNTPPIFTETIDGTPDFPLFSRSLNLDIFHYLFQRLPGHRGIREQSDHLVATHDGDYGRPHFSIHRRPSFFHRFARYRLGILQVMSSRGGSEYGCLILLFPVRHPCRAFQGTHLCLHGLPVFYGHRLSYGRDA